MRPWPLLALLVGGCAYYNGVYNTKRLAHDALQAEHEGRTLEANGLWGRVVLQAESTLARHPHTKWTTQTQLLQATGMARLNDCGRATPILQHVLGTATELKMREEAALQLGNCREALGDLDGAAAAYEELLHSNDPTRRSLALYEHGRTLRNSGDYEAALAELEQSSHPRAGGERAAALAGAGRAAEATKLADSLIAAGDTVAPWDSLFAGLARSDLDSATQLLDRAIAGLPASPQMKARLLRQDGWRWMASDTGRAAARFGRASELGGSSPAAAGARLDLVRLRLRSVQDASGAADLLDDLQDLQEAGGPTATPAARLEAVARMVVAGLDSVPAGAAQGDMRVFIAGELARDSLGSVVLANRLFGRVPVDWPDSPFAPKALLALALMHPEAAESLWQVASTSYPSSPYVAILRGEDPPDFRRFEDSLRFFSRASLVPPRRTPARPAPQPVPGQAPSQAPPPTRKPVEP
jgi:tetratricopeptide (TPR) repeat protein